MKSFEPGVLERQKFPASLLRTVRILGEWRARPIPPSTKALDRLCGHAFRNSIESSNRLDGLTIAPDRLDAIVAGRTEGESRAEQEVAGYREALKRIAGDNGGGQFGPKLVLQLHSDVYGFVPEGGGRWKMSDDLVTETLPDGSTAVIFTPVPSYGIEDAINRLHDGLAQQWGDGAIDPLLLIPAYLLDFLCIHPFSDGNDRMVRLLAMLLLQRAGYRVAGFVSLDPLFEQSRAQCSAALQASWNGWHRATHDLGPWSQYFLGIVFEAYRQFEGHIEIASPRRGAQRDRVADAVGHLPRDFRYVDLVRLVPSVSRPTINRVLCRLRGERVVRCVRRGRNARWQRN